jgi:TRAP-type mannitol/chloroaromatic compound transport system substrate-binding protein
MNKKSLLLMSVLVVCLAFALILTGCGGNQQPAAPQPQQGEQQAPVQIHRWQMQTALPAGDGMMDVLFFFSDTVRDMSGGRLLIEILPADAVVGPFEVLNAVNVGVVEAGQWWTHYATGQHPAAGLFNSRVGGGLNTHSYITWYYQGGGRDLYVEFYQQILGMDVIPFLHALEGPDNLGWFHVPVHTVDDFRPLRYRSPPGLPGEVYVQMGATPISMAGHEILPAAERGVIDGAEWSTPFVDYRLGFADVFDYLILGGLHQFICIGDILINGDVWRALPRDLQAIVEHAATASMFWTWTHFLYEDSKALESIEAAGTTILPLPAGYVEAFVEAAEIVLARHAANDQFFARVLESQDDFAKIVLPYKAANLDTSLQMARMQMEQWD